MLKRLLILSFVFVLSGTAFAQSTDLATEFSYQGYLQQNGLAITDTCGMTFALFDAQSGGSQITGTSTISLSSVAVSNGVFNVTLDFGAAAFDGGDHYLEIAVQCTGDSGPTTLSPRQPLTPAPYAIALYGLRTEPNATSPNLIGGYDGNSVGTGVVGATISGGGDADNLNNIYDAYGTIGGGRNNTVGSNDETTTNADYATVGGGDGNSATEDYSTVSGGEDNAASALHGTVGGGDGNTASANQSTISGGWGNIASGSKATIGGGSFNTASGSQSTVAGGADNIASSPNSTVGGGDDNSALGLGSTIAGGWYNIVEAQFGVIAGGGGVRDSDANIVYDDYGVIGGGRNNVVGTDDADTTTAAYATLSGGQDNTAAGSWSVVPGGQGNTAGGAYSFAAGELAQTTGDNSFVWSDGSISTTFTANNRFIAVSSGGATFYTGSLSTGVDLPAGGSGWIAVSDRNAKENFESVDPLSVLEALVAIPVTEWNYITQDDEIRHMGVMAQDFDAAFGLGEDPLGINSIDMDGVTVAAIQGLYQQNQDQQERLEAQDTQLEAQQARIDTLEARLATLEADGPKGGVSFNWLVLLALGTGAWLLLRKR